MNNSSNTHYQVEAEPIVSVQLKFIHPHGSVSKYEQEFSLVSPIRLLKEDMSLKLSVEVDRQVWIHKGVLLEDNDTLAEHGVDDEDSIEVIQN